MGSPPGKERKREFVDNPNGLFSAQAAPKPPPAMYSITEGMRLGGKVMERWILIYFVASVSSNTVLNYQIVFIECLQRTVIVPPEKGYGQKGMNEIPVKPPPLPICCASFCFNVLCLLLNFGQKC